MDFSNRNEIFVKLFVISVITWFTRSELMSQILLGIVLILSEKRTACNFRFASFPHTMLTISRSNGFIRFSAIVRNFLCLAIFYANLQEARSELSDRIFMSRERKF